MTTKPPAWLEASYDRAVKALITAGIWGDFDALYWFGAHDAQAARLNWISSSYDMTAVASPVFEPYRGYTGDGAASYVLSSFNPTTSPAPKYTQNSAHMGLWSRTNLANGASNSLDMGLSSNAYIGRLSATPGTSVGRMQAAAGGNIAAGSYPGHTVWSRDGTSVWAGYVNGVSGNNGTDASAPPTNSTMRGLAGNSGYGTNQLLVLHYGAKLTSTKVAALYAAFNQLKIDVGA